MFVCVHTYIAYVRKNVCMYVTWTFTFISEFVGIMHMCVFSCIHIYLPMFRSSSPVCLYLQSNLKTNKMVTLLLNY